ncbi:MAG: TIM barrel protein [Clostridia bacterium]|nr:TIM barrel protein [Clostridia bacterium]
MQALGLYRVKNDQLSISEILHLIKKTGFDFIAASSPAQLEDNAPNGFMQTAKRLNLPIDNVHLSGPRTSTIWYPGSEGDQIVERYCREIDISLNAGVRQGVVHVTWGLETPPLNDLGVERLKRIIAHAEKTGFVIGFENSVSLPHYEAVFDHIQSEAVRFTFDSGHWNEFCRETDIYRRYNELMTITHLNDNDGVHDMHVIPFDGCCDFKLLAPHLKRMDRLTFEVSGLGTRRYPQEEKVLHENMQRMAIYGNEDFLKIRGSEVELYTCLDYEGYLDRLMQAAKKLRKMIEEA